MRRPGPIAHTSRVTGVEWAVLAIATLVGVSVQSTVGFGFAFFVAPALFLTGSAAEAVILLLALGTLVNLLMLYGEKRPRGGFWPTVLPMVLWSLPGLAVGYLGLVLVPKEALQILVGLVIIAACLSKLRDVETAEVGRVTGSAALAGLSSGALTSATGLNGPPLLPWATRFSSTPNEMRHLVAAGLLALNSMGLLLVTIGGGGEGGLGDTALTFAILTPLVLLGHRVGRFVLTRLDAAGHRRIVLAAAGLTGTASVVIGGIALL